MKAARQVSENTGRVQTKKVLRAGKLCDKMAYSNRKIALRVAGEQSRVTRELIEAYHCFRCHCYHIGHPPGSR